MKVGFDLLPNGLQLLLRQTGRITLIRYGQLTNDEFFVSEAAAREGVVITNPSTCDPIVMLKHFGPGNPDLPPDL